MAHPMVGDSGAVDSPAILAVHPVLPARDVRASVAFFEALGFACQFLDAPDDPRYAAVTRDGCALHLQWADATQFDGPHDRPVVRLLVRGVDALYDAWRRAGAVPGPTAEGSPYAAPADTPWGTREFHVHDPSGNGVQCYEPR